MSAMKNLWERVKSWFSRERGEVRRETQAGTAFLTPEEGNAPPATLLDTARYTAEAEGTILGGTTRADSLPELTTHGLAWSMEPGVVPVDAAAVNEALCTQCRRYANDIAAQEVL